MSEIFISHDPKATLHACVCMIPPFPAKSDMTIGRAREVLAKKLWDDPEFNDATKMFAKGHSEGFLEGHASRDPEVGS